MSLRNRHLRTLRRLGHQTTRTDPQLAELLTEFTRLAAGQPMPTHERLRTPLSRAGALLAAPFRAALHGVRLAAAACAIADRWLAARLPDAAPGWAATGVWAGIQPNRPRLPKH